MAEELCKGTYNAFQMVGTVVVIASGNHGTAGYKVRLRDTPIAVFPPEYELVHTMPSGPVAQVETFFAVYAAFPAPITVDRVVIHDSEGRHEIEVEQTSDITRIIRCLLPGDPSTLPD